MIDPYALGLTVTGISGNEAYCLCPFHDDHSRSASFNMDNGKFICFACGEHSTAERLAKYLGGVIAPLDDSRVHRYAGESTKDWEWVMSCKQAIDNKYLASRKIHNGLVVKYDIREFSDGVAFLLYDYDKRPCGAQLRFYEGSLRYMTIGKKPLIWPLNRLTPRQGHILFVEGIFGAINARRCGIENTFAVMGVHSAINAVNIANGFRRKTVVFDSDDPGKISASKILAMRIGFEAYCPGAEADEVGVDFWNSVIASTARLVTNHHDMEELSGMSREAREHVERFIQKRKM